MLKLKQMGITIGLSLSLVLTGCGDEEDNQDKGNKTGETASLGEQVDYTITGIEPGAGLTGLSQNTLEDMKI
ncbi:hypothetical protein [Ureibacillus sinduriensis]|uniref:hypothetical protein n=1 Tax=Ureibacillus sinduriensis TaxID=561440 RepID=UPI000AFCD9D1|nr:hypothetical protein [Ureibacillus sinduriensis]